ncbi:MAG: diphthamide biosynthesis enzyme Dph2 [Methanimicrococcus sp.]|nr:diphthamide biosynthesis enzyme Dph2 [Methanimicrococcus sp.]
MNRLLNLEADVSKSVSESYDFEIDTIFEKIKDLESQKKTVVVGLQFPEGLKKHGFRIASQIKEMTGAEVYISADPCFGACDLDTKLIEYVDILFHFGHAPLNQELVENKVCFIETRSKADVLNAVKAALPLLTESSVGLLTTVQHVHQLEKAKAELEKAGKKVTTAAGDKRLAYPGQILGCNFSAAHSEDAKNCDVFLYIGSGRFHPIGIAISSKKRVVCADPFTSEAFELNNRQFLMQRSAVIGISSDAETFGILISVKNGQYRKKLAQSLKEKAEAHGKNAYLLFMDLVTPDQMLSFKADAFINTACPRLSIDDSGLFPAPVLTPQEFEIVIGERDWEDWVMDEILEGGQDE